ncbi:hypothetical protein F5B18DRAFT_489652 [Nemania serpens]|nr:hypothetical protein F5B18DRAFT_489652 [Nemania serpens]
MCIKLVSTYPCGHAKSRWELCGKARATKLLRLGNSEPCAKTIRKDEAPDLQDSCGSTCLAKPWKCNKCASQRKQLAWRCADCSAVRDNTVSTWSPCECPRHVCHNAILDSHFCGACRDRCLPKGSMLTWTCHACGSLARTYPTEMECGQCFHMRCGKCRSASSS